MTSLLSSLLRVRENKTTQKILVYLCLILLSVLVSSLHYCFSPLSDLAGHPDPGCFYMIGKAWAHGMTPYVDTVDIKGPLLFAFFAIGYLIHGTFGVYLLLTLCLFSTILGIYRITQLYISNNAISFLTISIFLFIYLTKFLSEGRAEDIMLSILVWAIYASLSCITIHHEPQRVLFAGRVLGVCAGAIMLIKYNAVVPLSFIALWLLLFCKEMGYSRKLISKYITLGLFYFSLVLIMVAVGLHSQKALFPCLEVYFDLFRAAGMLHIDLFSVANIRFCSLIIACIITVPFLLYILDWNHYSRWTSYFWIAYGLGTILACFKGMGYYYMIGIPIIIYPCTSITRVVKCNSGFKTAGILLATGMIFLLSLRHDIRKTYNRHMIQPVTYEKVVDDEISKIKNARILYLKTLDLGLGSRNDALPACRYWMTLNGDVFHSLPEQLQCAERRIPDFIITLKAGALNETVEKSGYVWVNEGKVEDYDIILWKKQVP